MKVKYICGKQELAKQFRNIMFTSFLFEQLAHLGKYYSTEEEFVKHLLSGEVTVSIPDLLRYQSQYDQQKADPPYTEAQLVGFGNYLLKRYNVQEYSTDGKNTPLFQRQVCDADFRNWLDSMEAPPNINITGLPSQFNIGDKVFLSIKQTFGDNPYPFTASVLAIHFYTGKVKYDLEIPIAEEAPTRIYNIDSCFVFPAES